MAKLAVALSGGVDSSVTALLLKEAGHQVWAFSLRLGQGQDQAWQRGAQAARQLGLPHAVVEAGPRFEAQVVGYSARAYAQGLTPNPCARCNARVKLPLLWRAARELGCQGLATGHYARLESGPAGPRLREGLDQGKSQAYFLARTPAGLLRRVLFPLGGLRKAQVREMAARAGLEAAQARESQDCCFLPPGGWDQVLAERDLLRQGLLEDPEGRVLGAHGGLHRFTVGQRRGLGLAVGSPLYVLGLDGQRAAVKVGPESGLWSGGLWASRPRWRLPWPQLAELAGRDELRVRLRYAHRGEICRLALRQGRLRVDFASPQRAVAPGQLAVFYQGDSVVGSAWIDG